MREAEEAVRSGGARSYASAQHPIALAVLFCMIIPLAIYLMRFSPWPRNPVNRRVFYAIALGFLLLGLLTTISRTATVTLGVMLLVTLILRPRLGGILLAAALPLAVIAAMVLPKLVEIDDPVVPRHRFAHRIPVDQRREWLGRAGSPISNRRCKRSPHPRSSAPGSEAGSSRGTTPTRTSSTTSGSAR